MKFELMHTNCKMVNQSQDEKYSSNFFCPGCEEEINFEDGPAVHYCMGRETNNDDYEAVDENSVPQIAFWSSENTMKLINYVKDLTPKLGPKFKLKTKKQMWKFISNELSKNGEYEFTPLQVENRWKNMERGLRNTSNKKGKGKSRIALYRKVLEPLVKLRPTEDSDKLKEKSAGDGNETEVEISFIEDFVEEDSPSSKGEVSKSHLGNEFNQFLKMKRKQHEDKMELRRTQIRLFEERTKEMKRKNDLLEKLVNIMSNNCENFNVDNI